MDLFANRVLGETPGHINIDTSAEHRAAAVAIASQCKRLLDIAARQLDPVVYDTPEFLEAVKQLALRSRWSQIRLLVLQPDGLAGRGHRLLQLANQLSTFITVRRPGETHKDFNEGLFIADQAGVIRRPLADRYEALVSFNDPVLAAAMQRRFDEVWDRAEPDPNFRRLHL